MITDGERYDPQQRLAGPVASMVPSVITDGEPRVREGLGQAREEASMVPSVITDGEDGCRGDLHWQTRASMVPSVITDGEVRDEQVVTRG